MSEAMIALEHPCLLGEGPHWDQDKGQLLYVDILGHCFHRFTPETGEVETFDLPEMVSAVIPCEGGSYLLTLEHSVVLYDTESRDFRTLVELEKDLPNNRLNEAKCDAAGRLWCGSMNKSILHTSGNLYLLDSDLNLTRQLDSLIVSNGITWTADNRTMYYTDTQTYRIDAFDFDFESGGISNRRIVMPVSLQNGLTDGMTIDKEGMLWLALWEGGKVVRIDPGRGQIIETYPVPAYRVTSVTFGGEKLNELYITSARMDTSDELLEKYPYSGGLLKLATTTEGYPGNPFRMR